MPPSISEWARAAIIVGLLAWTSTARGTDRWAALTDPLFFNLSALHGLPSGRVSGIAQDGEGFVWLVTGDGLMRYDGRDFTRLETGIADIDTDIRSIRSGTAGHLWIGTGQGLHRLEPMTGEVRSYPLRQGDGFAVMSIEEAGHGGDQVMWVGTEHGVFQVFAESGEVVAHLQEEVNEDRTMRVFVVVHDRKGRTWAGTSQGLYRKLADEAAFARLALEPWLPTTARISELLEQSSGELWIATPRDGALRLDTRDQLQRVAIPDFANEWIYAVAEVAPGKIWLGTYGRGIIEWTETGVTRLQHHPLIHHSLGHDEIWTIRPDRRGRVWIGTGRGVSLHDPSQTAVLAAFGGSGAARKLRDREVKSLLETRDGTLLVGLRKSGVDIVDPQRGRVGNLDVDIDRPESALPGGAVETMVEAPDGAIYIGSNWGLYRYRGDQLARLTLAGRSSETFTGSLLLHQGVLWAGGIDGLWRLEPDSDPVAAQRLEVSVSEQFTDPRISTLAASPEGRLVAGTWNGANWLDSSGSVVARIRGGTGESAILQNGYITSIAQDAEGRTWLGTSGAGLYRFEPNLVDHVRLTREHGLPSDQIGSLQIDLRGRVWVSSNGGISVIDRRSLEVITLGPADGVVMAPYYRQPGLVTREGEVLFGGDGGLTIIRAGQWEPAAEHAYLAVASVAVGDATLDRRSVGETSEAPVIVPAQVNEIAAQFVALDYLAARHLRYRYRLPERSNSWRPAPQGSVTFSSLPPGHYRIEVQASNRYGQWGEDTRSLHFSVLPLWYQTSWAKWTGLIAALLGFTALLRWYTSRLRRRQIRLEGMIEERTYELRQSADALREKSAELERVSMTDPLTGMNNRRFLEKYMPAEQALSIRRYHDSDTLQVDAGDLIFFMVDLDNFKQINDQYGHAAGDEILIEMRNRLLEVFRETDYLVRWGGEEFLAVARGTARQHAGGVAERIRQSVGQRPFLLNTDVGSQQKESVEMTCSIGYSALPFSRRYPERAHWLKNVHLSDMALYAAKRAGRNAWVGLASGTQFEAEFEAETITRDPALALARGWVVLSSNLDAEKIGRAWSSLAQPE